jgi:hypothetical protein
MIYIHLFNKTGRIVEKKKSHILPIITLLVLAPVLGELLSGSSPPSEYFQPISFILLTMLYGIGALLIRETANTGIKAGSLSC